MALAFFTIGPIALYLGMIGGFTYTMHKLCFRKWYSQNFYHMTCVKKWTIKFFQMLISLTLSIILATVGYAIIIGPICLFFAIFIPVIIVRWCLSSKKVKQTEAQIEIVQNEL